MPKTRITVPEGHAALLLTETDLRDLGHFMLLIRKATAAQRQRTFGEDAQASSDVAGSVLIAMLEQGWTS